MCMCYLFIFQPTAPLDQAHVNCPSCCTVEKEEGGEHLAPGFFWGGKETVVYFMTVENVHF
jgi:hypothetical protein